MNLSIPRIQARIRQAQTVSPLAKAEITLLAASKGQMATAIEAAIASGIRHFGENRVQEAKEKWPTLKIRHPNTRLHLIGPLQTNKLRDAVELFDVIETLDRTNLAEALAAECNRQQRWPECFIQVNIGREPQKSGVAIEETAALLARCKELGLNVSGLMCIPPQGEIAAPYFALLRKLSQALGISQLSMGMSDDFETAIRLGATEVRLGRALFAAD